MIKRSVYSLVGLLSEPLLTEQKPSRRQLYSHQYNPISANENLVILFGEKVSELLECPLIELFLFLSTNSLWTLICIRQSYSKHISLKESPVVQFRISIYFIYLQKFYPAYLTISFRRLTLKLQKKNIIQSTIKTIINKSK